MKIFQIQLDRRCYKIIRYYREGIQVNTFLSFVLLNVQNVICRAGEHHSLSLVPSLRDAVNGREVGKPSNVCKLNYYRILPGLRVFFLHDIKKSNKRTRYRTTIKLSNDNQ